MNGKYEPARLPNVDEALAWAEEREKWAAEARAVDRPGTAKEFELTALLLRWMAEHR